jgi:L-ascorbate metabolism protein UlaG (beta-lactamase superfamily)
MRITFLGHASWLVTSGEATILTDPVLTDFRSGTFSISPTRALDLDRLPRIDAVVITHRHRDHFDLGTLHVLDKTTTIFCPRDPVILHALRRFGFQAVVPVADWSHETFRDVTMLFTPSANRVPEHGVLFSDGEVLFWDQADTVIRPNTLETIRAHVDRRIDVVAHVYQPMMETEVLNALSLEFPIDEYAAILHLAELLAPRAIVPGSNGYRVNGEHAWINAYKFPVTRERFVRDVRAVLPDVATFVPNPGDVLAVTDARVRLLRQSAPNQFVRTTTDDAAALTRFNPGGPKPALADANPHRVRRDRLRRSVRLVFEERFLPIARKATRTLDPLLMLDPLIECRVVYPGGDVENWAIDFRRRMPRIAVRPIDDTSDFVMEIAASTLHHVMTGETRVDIVSLAGQYRQFSRPYRIRGGRVMSHGQAVPSVVHGDSRARGGAVGLLFSWLMHEPDAEVRLVDVEIDRLLGRRQGDAVPFWKRIVEPPPSPHA